VAEAAADVRVAAIAASSTEAEVARAGVQAIVDGLAAAAAAAKRSGGCQKVGICSSKCCCHSGDGVASARFCSGEGHGRSRLLILVRSFNDSPMGLTESLFGINQSN